MNKLLSVAPAVVGLLAINIGIFLINLTAGAERDGLISGFALFYFDSPNFQWYQILTHMFMHAGLAHLLFNMFALLIFGGQLEAVLGTRRFLIFYFVTGIGAVFLHQAVLGYEIYQIVGAIAPASQLTELSGLTPSELTELRIKYGSSVVGASGAIYGLLLGFAVLFPNAKLVFLFFPVPVKAKYLIPVLMLIELFLGVRQFSFDNIAHFAHLGGALFGFILIKLWFYRVQQNKPQ